LWASGLLTGLIVLGIELLGNQKVTLPFFS
jgi:hypothetical protein